MRRQVLAEDTRYDAEFLSVFWSSWIHGYTHKRSSITGAHHSATHFYTRKVKKRHTNATQNQPVQHDRVKPQKDKHEGGHQPFHLFSIRFVQHSGVCTGPTLQCLQSTVVLHHAAGR